MWTRVPKEERPTNVDVQVLAAWRREDGLMVFRVPNSWPLGSPTYSIYDAESGFWRDKAGKRRWWGDLGECRKAADNGEQKDDDGKDDVDAREPEVRPKKKRKAPKRKARRKAEKREMVSPDRAAEIRAFSKSKPQPTYGDVIERFALSGWQEAYDIIHGSKEAR